LNVGIGYAAKEANTTGAASVAIGAYAGRCNTTGGDNVSMGYAAMFNNTTGGTNTAIGCIALCSNTTGASNTAMGKGAGAMITTGDNNLLLGFDAGRTGSPGGNLTIEDNIIVLGDENITASNIQVDWTVASDARDKTDFTDLDIGLDFINALKPYTYKWDKRIKYISKENRNVEDLDTITHDGTHKEDWLDIGFKAQEVETLEKASGYKIEDKTNLTTSLTGDGKMYGIQYSKFIPILVNAIKELKAEIEELKNK